LLSNAEPGLISALNQVLYRGVRLTTELITRCSAYVLLVIFIIMTTASVQGTKVNLPKASTAPNLGKASTQAITVTNDGKIFLDTVPGYSPKSQGTIEIKQCSPNRSQLLGSAAYFYY
jgi:biopolymer transport protein ExbD